MMCAQSSCLSLRYAHTVMWGLDSVKVCAVELTFARYLKHAEWSCADSHFHLVGGQPKPIP